MRLAGIDLNLLTSLDAILDERNVTRAAKRLGVSQPAVSHSLRRLRELLGDPLLVRSRAGMTPTPRAIELRPAVRAALDAADVVLRAAPAFDPANAARTFTIAMGDQQSFVLLPRLVERLDREAPNIQLDVRPPPTNAFGGDVDLSLGVFFDAPSNTRNEPLWHEEFVCVLRKHSAASRGPLDRKRYLALPHLLVAPGGAPGSHVDDLLALRGERRRVAIRVPHFLVAPHIVATTDLVWTAPQGIAREFVDHLPIVLRDVPFKIEGFTITMRWHARFDRDPGLAWLRGRLREVAPQP